MVMAFFGMLLAHRPFFLVDFDWTREDLRDRDDAFDFALFAFAGPLGAEGLVPLLSFAR